MDGGSNAELRNRRKGRNAGTAERILQRRRTRPPKPSSLQKSFLCLIICSALLLGILMLCGDILPWHVGHRAADNVAKIFGYSSPVYAVVIDAGSTGSRVLAFSFHKAFFNREYLVLDKELFEHTKPGLSSFADEPKKAVESISQLIELAKREIPPEYWSETPLILKATAGLRLLPPQKAEALLSAVRKLFKQAPFLTDENSVSIMDGTDEGIFSWFTVNFLLDKTSNPTRTVAALDLGGGSTQVTFSALTPDTLQHKKFIEDALLPQGTTKVYTNSFLGLGLMAARKEIVTINQTGQAVHSPCINPIIKDKTFPYGGVDYIVGGLTDNYPKIISPHEKYMPGQMIPIVDFDVCANIVKNYVVSKMSAPVELSDKTIFAFSYYFDRAADVGLIEESKGGVVTVYDFKKAAKEACNIPNADQPFMCLDLTFISILFEDGLGLEPETSIYLYKKIKNHEISWALGAAFKKLKGDN